MSDHLRRGASGLELIAEDLDRDGYADLALSTAQGMVNLYYDYWRFDSRGGHFVALGNYPVLERVGNTGELATFERGSCCTYARHRYHFAGDTLVRVHSDVTDYAAVGSNSIVRVVQVRRGDGMHPLCREAILNRDSADEERSDTIAAPTRCPAELAADQPSR
ncbi:MAG TPA: hypothetical protein VGB66_14370 [Longimicrobium sp.]